MPAHERGTPLAVELTWRVWTYMISEEIEEFTGKLPDHYSISWSDFLELFNEAVIEVSEGELELLSLGIDACYYWRAEPRVTATRIARWITTARDLARSRLLADIAEHDREDAEDEARCAASNAERLDRAAPRRTAPEGGERT